MKRFLLSAVLLYFSTFLFAGTKTWIGASGSNWNNAANWNPNGVPVAGDDVVINTSGTISIDAGSPIALNSIAVTNNSTVVFDCAATKNFRLSSTSSATPGLLVDVGSTLTLDGSNAGTNNSAFDLTFGTGVIGSIYGTLIMSKTGGSPSSPGIQLITDNNTTNYGIVTVYSGGAIKINPNAGNTSSSLTPVPTIVMKDGSLYENLKNGGSFPAGTWEPNSLAKHTGFVNGTVSFLGSVYGNLEWNCPNQTAIVFFNKDISFNNVNLVSTGVSVSGSEMRIKTGTTNGEYTMTVNGNLTIGSDASLVLTSLNTPNLTGNGAKLFLKGNLVNDGSIATSGNANTTNVFELNGTTNQAISSTGNLMGAYIPGSSAGLTLSMNNPAGATLGTSIILPANLALVFGKITTTNSKILTMINGATYSANLNNSFIDGPMTKIGDEDFTFPVGKGSIYAPITINNASGSNTSDMFTAEYIRANPHSSVGNVYGDPLTDHMSYCEYWRLIEVSGTGSKYVALTVNAESFCKDINSTFVGRYVTGSGWVNEGAQVLGTPGAVGAYDVGTIRIANPVSDFGFFTLGTNLPFGINPLPINLVTFNANKVSDNKAFLNWELAACCLSAAKFEVERAGDDRNFKIIASTGGSETNRFYSLPDNDLKRGINYYRLKMTDADGTVTYSRIAAVLNGIKGVLITMSPTIVRDNAALTLTSASAGNIDLLVVDMMGRTMKKISQKMQAGNCSLTISFGDLRSGTYQIFAISAEGKTNIIKFIKE